MPRINTTESDHRAALDLMGHSRVTWSQALASPNAKLYQLTVNRIAELLAESRELEAVRERAIVALRWAIAHLPASSSGDSEAYQWGLDSVRATLASFEKGA